MWKQESYLSSKTVPEPFPVFQFDSSPLFRRHPWAFVIDNIELNSVGRSKANKTLNNPLLIICLSFLCWCGALADPQRQDVVCGSHIKSRDFCLPSPWILCKVHFTAIKIDLGLSSNQILWPRLDSRIENIDGIKKGIRWKACVFQWGLCQSWGGMCWLFFSFLGGGVIRSLNGTKEAVAQFFPLISCRCSRWLNATLSFPSSSLLNVWVMFHGLPWIWGNCVKIGGAKWLLNALKQRFHHVCGMLWWAIWKLTCSKNAVVIRIV